MCVVSNIGDSYRDSFPDKHPWYPANPFTPNPPIFVPAAEFEKLKKEVEELKEQLKKAKKFDEETGQKDCEMEEKIAFLRRIADAVGVSMDDVFPPK